MTHSRMSRRRFMGTASTVAAGAYAATRGAPVLAQGKRVLNARLQRDISILDPGYMVGGGEIDVQNAIIGEDQFLSRYYFAPQFDDTESLTETGIGTAQGIEETDGEHGCTVLDGQGEDCGRIQ